MVNNYRKNTNLSIRIDEEDMQDKRKQQRKAFEIFFEKIEKNSQEELSDIFDYRVKISRDVCVNNII